MSSEIVRVIHQRDPLDRTDRKIDELIVGSTISEILDQLKFKNTGSVEIRVILNGVKVEKDHWDFVMPGIGDELIITYQLGAIGAVFGFFVAALAKIGITGGLATALATVGTALVYAGGSYLLSLGITSLIGTPNTPGKADRPEPSGPNNTDLLRNRLIPGEPIWRVMGHFRVYPPFGAFPFNERDGDYIRMTGLFVVSHGPNKLSKPQIGERSLNEFRDSTITLLENTMEVNYPRIFQAAPNHLLKDEFAGPGGAPSVTGDSDEYVLGDEAERIKIDFQIPQGLQRYKVGGGKDLWGFDLLIGHKISGGGSFTSIFSLGTVIIKNPDHLSVIRHNDKITLHGKTAEEIRFSVEFRLPRDLYTIKTELNWSPTVMDFITSPENALNKANQFYPKSRGGQGGGSAQLLTDLVVEFVTGFIDEPAVVTDFPISAVLLSLTDEASSVGANDQFNIMNDSEHPIYTKGLGDNNGTWSAPTVTRNNVWLAMEVLRGTANLDPVSDTKLDMDSAKDVADWCDELVSGISGIENRHVFDAIISDQKSVGEWVQNILTNAGATISRSGRRIKFIVDKPLTDIVQHFSPENIKSLKVTRRFDDIPDGLKIAIRDGDEDGDGTYQESELVVYNDGFAKTTATYSGSIDIIAGPAAQQIDLIRPSGDFLASGFPREGYLIVNLGAIVNKQVLILKTFADRIRVYDPLGIFTPPQSLSGTVNTVKAKKFETLDTFGITRKSEGFRLGRKKFAEGKLRPFIYEIEADVETHLCQKMDLIRLNHPTIQEISGSGRIFSASPNLTAAVSIDLDFIVDVLPIGDPNYPVNGYAIRIRSIRDDGTMVSRVIAIDATATITLRALAQSQKKIVFVTPQNLDVDDIEVGPTKGSLVFFGELNKDSRELVVKEVVNSSNESSVLICEDHAPALHSSDVAPIPDLGDNTPKQQGLDLIPPARPNVLLIDEDGGLSFGPGTLNVAGNSTGLVTVDIVKPGTGGGTNVDLISPNPADGTPFLGWPNGPIRIRRGYSGNNSGWFLKTGDNGIGTRITISDPAGVLSSETGNGDEEIDQTYVQRLAGNFLTDGFVIDRNVRLTGFEKTIGLFEIGFVDPSFLGLNDEARTIRTEAGSGDEQLRESGLSVRYEIVETEAIGSDRELYAIITVSPGFGEAAVTTSYKGQWKFQNSFSWRDLGEVVNGQFRIGPLVAGELEIDFRALAYARSRMVSDWVYATTRNAEEIQKPKNMAATHDLLKSNEMLRPAIKLTWDIDPADALLVKGFYLRWFVQSVSTEWTEIRINLNGPEETRYSHIVPTNTFGKYLFIIQSIHKNGSFSLPLEFNFEFKANPLISLIAPTGLEVDSQGLDAEYKTRAPVFSWRSVGDSLEDEFENQFAGLIDPLRAGYLIQIIAATKTDPNAIVHQEIVERNRWTYEYGDNERHTRKYPLPDDSLHYSARRNYRFGVAFLDIYGRPGDFTYIDVTNSTPAAIDDFTLESVPGGSGGGNNKRAVVYVNIIPGESDDVEDFNSWGVWASTDPFFIPDKDSFQTEGRTTSLNFKWPVDQTVYVKVAGIDSFFKNPKKIEDTSELNFLPAKSISTARNATTPIETDDITPQAVTDMGFSKADEIEFNNDNENYWNIFGSFTADPASENVGSTGVSNVEKIGDGPSCQLRLVHLKEPDGVMFDNGSGPVSKLTEAISGATNDVPLPADHVNDILWVGSLEKFDGVFFDIGTEAVGSHALANPVIHSSLPNTTTSVGGTIQNQWTEAAFLSKWGFDETDAFRNDRKNPVEPTAVPALPGIIIPFIGPWVQVSIGGSAPMFWMGFRIINSTPSTAPLANKLWIARLIDYSGEMGPWTGKASFSIAGSINESKQVFVQFQGYRKPTTGSNWNAKHNILQVHVGKR